MTASAHTAKVSPADIAKVDALSKEFAMHFYQHDYPWCMELFDPQVTYLGSTVNGYAVGFDGLEATMRHTLDQFNPSFPMSIESYSRAVGSEAILTLMRFYLVASPLSGDVRAGRKRGTLLWLADGGSYRLRHIHFSSPFIANTTNPEVQSIAPHDTHRYAKTLLERIIRSNPVVVRDTQGVVYRLAPLEVCYVEAKRQQCVIHCLERELVVRRSFAKLVEEFDKALITLHRSYAVNPSYVLEVHPDFVVLEDGSRIPLPQRRSKEVRAQLEKAMRRQTPHSKPQEQEPHLVSLAEGIEEMAALPPLPMYWEG